MKSTPDTFHPTKCTGGLTPTPKSQGSQKRRQLLNIPGRQRRGNANHWRALHRWVHVFKAFKRDLDVFRRLAGQAGHVAEAFGLFAMAGRALRLKLGAASVDQIGSRARSEEHTSELQS